MEERVVIDKAVCIGCGACVKDCPGKALNLCDGKAEYLHRCINCGHCVAICPVNAVSIPGYDMADVEAYDRDSFTVRPENFLHGVKFRRSIRNYLPEPLEREKLERIIDAGRYTATAKNMQACKFVIIQEKLEEFKALFWQEMPVILKNLEESKPAYVRPFTLFYENWKKDQGEDTFFFNSTSLLIISAENLWDAGLAAANMEQMAVAEGGGALYSGYLQRSISASPELMRWLGLEGRSIACCMLLGYPAVSYERTAPRKPADVSFL